MFATNALVALLAAVAVVASPMKTPCDNKIPIAHSASWALKSWTSNDCTGKVHDYVSVALADDIKKQSGCHHLWRTGGNVNSFVLAGAAKRTYAVGVEFFKDSNCTEHIQHGIFDPKGYTKTPLNVGSFVVHNEARPKIN
ncbi:hypothetical protein BV22DRAFT_1125868 [Leucogyrophana mollusca]|uniref:Uncharacterized protein n=1 Tax=Leucogyrophana mollusca TaxID=85980 RepID=A0ACB8BWM9_9AGAM|nr:hypothetical protein BV22DRAFT_1125868 [Leucogyrophana mollusca]